jgi:hypothetical protein
MLYCEKCYIDPILVYVHRFAGTAFRDFLASVKNFMVMTVMYHRITRLKEGGREKIQYHMDSISCLFLVCGLCMECSCYL